MTTTPEPAFPRARPLDPRPSDPTVAELREVTQPPSVRGRRSSEHWTGDLYQRRISPYLTRLLLGTSITANGVTWLMMDANTALRRWVMAVTCIGML